MWIVSHPFDQPEHWKDSWWKSGGGRRVSMALWHPQLWKAKVNLLSSIQISLETLLFMIRCGATLLHSSSQVTLVVTAAHCASLPRRGLSLTCSGHELIIDPETGTQSFKDGHQLNIISIKTHEEYDDIRYINDIALIFAEVN